MSLTERKCKREATRETARQNQILISSLTKRERLRGERLLCLLGSFRTTVFHPSGSLYRQLEDSGARRRLTSFLGGKAGWQGGEEGKEGEDRPTLASLYDYRTGAAQRGTERSEAAPRRLASLFGTAAIKYSLQLDAPDRAGAALWYN